MEAFYESDALMLNGLTEAERTAFTTFIDELEGILDGLKGKHGDRPYGKPLAKSTGLLCWKDSFDDGMSASEAFEMDCSYQEDD